MLNRVPKHSDPVAFFSAEAPQTLHAPLAVRAPEAMFNHLSTQSKIEIGPWVDV